MLNDVAKVCADGWGPTNSFSRHTLLDSPLQYRWSSPAHCKHAKEIGLAVKRAGGQIYGRCRVVGHNRSKIVKNLGAWLRRSGIPDSVHVAHPDGGTSGLAGGTG